MYFLYFEVRARCRRKSSRSLSHLLMSFLFSTGTKQRVGWDERLRT